MISLAELKSRARTRLEEQWNRSQEREAKAVDELVKKINAANGDITQLDETEARAYRNYASKGYIKIEGNKARSTI